LPLCLNIIINNHTVLKTLSYFVCVDLFKINATKQEVNSSMDVLTIFLTKQF